MVPSRGPSPTSRLEITIAVPVRGSTRKISSLDVGEGPRLGTIYHIDAAPDTGVAFVPDREDKVVALDLVTGQRVVVAR